MTEISMISNPAQLNLEIVKIGYLNHTNLSLVLGNPGAGNWVYGETVIAVAHGLSYTPLVIGFDQQSATIGYTIPNYSYIGFASTIAIFDYAEIYADATYVYYIVKIIAISTGTSFGGATSVPLLAKYFLLRESIS